jgi:hypothetical protein
MSSSDQLQTEIAAVIKADMRVALADLDPGVALTPDTMGRLKSACAASVQSLMPDYEVVVDPVLCTVSIKPKSA